MKGIDDIIMRYIHFSLTYVDSISKKDTDVKITILHNKLSDKALFIVPHWGGSLLLYKPIINKLKSKYTIIICQLPDKILDQNIKNTLKYFNKAKRKIIKPMMYLE